MSEIYTFGLQNSSRGYIRGTCYETIDIDSKMGASGTLIIGKNHTIAQCPFKVIMVEGHSAIVNNDFNPSDENSIKMVLFTENGHSETTIYPGSDIDSALRHEFPEFASSDNIVNVGVELIFDENSFSKNLTVEYNGKEDINKAMFGLLRALGVIEIEDETIPDICPNVLDSLNKLIHAMKPEAPTFYRLNDAIGALADLAADGKFSIVTLT